MPLERKDPGVMTDGSHGHETANIAWVQSPYIASPSAAEVRDILIANGLMAEESGSSV